MRAYQFRLLYQLRYHSHLRPKEHINITHIFLQYLKEVRIKALGGKATTLAHYGLVKLLMSYALARRPRNISLDIFLLMSDEDFETFQTHTPKETSTGIEPKKKKKDTHIASLVMGKTGK